MTADQIADRIRTNLPEVRVEVNDMTGTRDHWEVKVVSPAFRGKLPLARHRMIYDLFTEELKGPIHALTLSTKTPDELDDEPH